MAAIAFPSSILRACPDVGYAHDYGFGETLGSLRSVPGMGFVIAMTLYTEIIDIFRFKKFDHLASFIGLIPGVHGSGGPETDTGMISRYNKYLRYLLIEAAWIAIREDPALTLKFAELSKRMKKQDAIMRIARKLLSRIRYGWTVMRWLQSLYLPGLFSEDCGHTLYINLTI